MRSPRLHIRDHLISSTLIKIAGTPAALFVVGVSILAYVFYQYFTPGFDELWALPKLTLFIGSGGLMIGMLDIVSNAYQEVSADTRQVEVMEFLTQQNQATLERLDRIEHTLTFPDEPKHS